MKVTKKSLSNALNVSVSNIEQLGSKQLFIVEENNTSMLFSHRTCIGVYCHVDNCWYVTTKKYSTTTSKQCSQFLNEYCAKRVGQEDINTILVSYNLSEYIEDA